MPDAPGAGAAASLSARRAWIEMCLRSMFWLFLPVALRKESVDRNPCCSCRSRWVLGRSPQGERG